MLQKHFKKSENAASKLIRENLLNHLTFYFKFYFEKFNFFLFNKEFDKGINYSLILIK